jgi:hypothetical protein
MNQANNTPIPSQEPPPDYGPDPIPPDELIGTPDDPTGAEPGTEWRDEITFEPDAWFRDQIAPTPDFGPVDMTPEELAAAEGEPDREELWPPDADPEDAEAERLLYGMSSDGNALLRDMIGRQQGRN